MIKKEFIECYQGNEVYKYTVSDEIEVEISTLGATLLSLKTPDKNGVMTDVLLGFQNADDMIDYQNSLPTNKHPTVKWI